MADLMGDFSMTDLEKANANSEIPGIGMVIRSDVCPENLGALPDFDSEESQQGWSTRLQQQNDAYRHIVGIASVREQPMGLTEPSHTGDTLPQIQASDVVKQKDSTVGNATEDKMLQQVTGASQCTPPKPTDPDGDPPSAALGAVKGGDPEGTLAKEGSEGPPDPELNQQKKEQWQSRGAFKILEYFNQTAVQACAMMQKGAEVATMQRQAEGKSELAAGRKMRTMVQEKMDEMRKTHTEQGNTEALATLDDLEKNLRNQKPSGEGGEQRAFKDRWKPVNPSVVDVASEFWPASLRIVIQEGDFKLTGLSNLSTEKLSIITKECRCQRAT